jgi:bifunctional enzyme CysN/CysC
LTLEDEIDISRGDMIVRRHNIPNVENEFEATLVWMDERRGLSTESQYILQHTTRTTQAFVDKVLYQIDVNTLHRSSAASLSLNEIGRVKITTANQLFFDPYDRNRSTGGFILVDPNDFRTVASGMIRYSSQSTIDELKKLQRQRNLADTGPSKFVSPSPGLVPLEERARRTGHKPICVCLSCSDEELGAGVARHVEKKLFDRGRQAVCYDTEKFRNGLNADLGHTAGDRREIIRRAGHICRFLYDSGFAVIYNPAAPQELTHELVRSRFPAEGFVEIRLEDASKDTDDSSGARTDRHSNESPPPPEPELRLTTGQGGLEALAEEIIGYILRHCNNEN